MSYLHFLRGLNCKEQKCLLTHSKLSLPLNSDIMFQIAFYSYLRDSNSKLSAWYTQSWSMTWEAKKTTTKVCLLSKLIVQYDPSKILDAENILRVPKWSGTNLHVIVLNCFERTFNLSKKYCQELHLKHSKTATSYSYHTFNPQNSMT